MQTENLSALTIATAATYTGATVLSATENWINADGSAGHATIADNVEAFATGTPIFALSGDDTLSGTGGNDVFVFAQPIGNDTIYNFNVATDKIDLAGFLLHITAFGDIQANIIDNGNGDAVVTVGLGQTITLHGVDAASLAASDFVFNQDTVVNNADNMVISDGAMLPVGGTINNAGTIALNSTGDATELQIIGDGITLEGGGQIVLSDSYANTIVGTNAGSTLTNIDNTISGAGQIGSGDGTLALVNEAHGTIEADIAGSVLTFDPGAQITNDGVLEAANGGVLQIEDSIHGGNAVIEGGVIEFDAASNVAVAFNNGAGGTAYGELVLADPSQFSGQISGFTGTAPDASHSDEIDLAGINFNSGHFSDMYDSATGLLTVTDGINTESLAFTGFSGNASNFDFSADAAGTGTLITDPPAANTEQSVDTSASENGIHGTITFADAGGPEVSVTPVTPEDDSDVGRFNLSAVTESKIGASVEFGFSLDSDQVNLSPGQTATQSYEVNLTDPHNPAANASQTVSVSLGGPGNDNFIFSPGIGADTVLNFNPQQDTIELDHFAQAQTVAQLQSLITTDAHGDAFIDLGNHDSITLPGITAQHLQAVLQSAVHLH